MSDSPIFLFLEKVHPSIEATVDRILRGENRCPKAIVRDFDGSQYHILVDLGVRKDCNERRCEDTIAGSESNGDGAVSAESLACKAAITVAVRHFTPLEELNAHGNFYDVLPTLFPPTVRGFIQTSVSSDDAGAPVVFHIPAGVADATLREALQVVGSVRVWSFAPVFLKQCELFLSDPASVRPLVLHYHPGEEMVLFSYSDNFTISVSMRASSKDEALLMRHFLQSMADARRISKELAGTPTFAFEQGTVPDELRAVGAPVSNVANEDHFWCSFQLFRQQMEAPSNLIDTVTRLVNFRNFVSYHISAGRTFMHGMMRKRVEASLQVLNKAKTHITGKPKITLD
ncbi:putative ARP2/3 complex subunit [Trypanosoma vivax]|uniref:Arp2/3 complex 34 kDa subunit n=1 Tax=Trypanosoma vivax (strain Y486) TaxID=1055687 RepID=G0U121_TRYVY|nr:putative ARP2/3 complex subunit [Trypanosoma vivax]CCC49776.1 putative ARP2/3 complex subunit [Trypanosoma vivax Y486]